MFSAGWKLRCGDDGSERSRGTLTNPSSPPADVTPPDPRQQDGLQPSDLFDDFVLRGRSPAGSK